MNEQRCGIHETSPTHLCGAVCPPCDECAHRKVAVLADGDITFRERCQHPRGETICGRHMPCADHPPSAVDVPQPPEESATDYKPIPVATAQCVAADFDKSIVIIASWDPIHGQLHVTTYGDKPEEKEWAADGGELVAKALGAMPEQSTYHENYRQHCCVKAGHVRLVPERACRGCGTTAEACEARPVACGTFPELNTSDCGPCCPNCFHQSVSCVAHAEVES